MQRGGVQSYKPPNSHSGPLELLRRGVKDVVAALVSQEATVERFAGDEYRKDAVWVA